MESESWLSKAKNLITVEPVLILYFTTIIVNVGLTHFEFEKACAADLQIDLSTCEQFHKFDTLNISCILENEAVHNESSEGPHYDKIACRAYKKSEDKVVELNSYRSTITGTIQVIILLFAGGWSDKTKLRKPLILAPMLGDALKYIVQILSSIFMQQIPLWVPGLLGDVMYNLLGGGSVFLLGIYSYVSDHTNADERTFRFAFVGVVSVAIPILMNIAAGPLYLALGMTNLLILCLIITVISLLYGIFFLDETDKKNIDCSNNDDGKRSFCIKKFIIDFFSLALIKDLIKALAVKRQFNGRQILLIAFVVYFINYCAAGDTLYATLLAKSIFNWISQIGYWISYDIGTTLIGTLLIVGVLSKWLHISDALICVISVIFTLLSKPLMIYAVMSSKSIFYVIATSIDIFDGSKSIAIKSLLSKLVGEQDIAKIFSILYILESAQAIICPTLYSIVFINYNEHFIGSIFVLSIIFLILSLLMYIYLYILCRDHNNQKQAAVAKNTQNLSGYVNEGMVTTHL